MIGSVVKPSRETEKRILINQLHAHKIYETLKGEPLESKDYYTLRTMLATARAVVQ